MEAFGWLVGWLFWIDESKNSKPLPAPTASALGPCSTVIQIVKRPATGSLPSTIAPPDECGSRPLYIDNYYKCIKYWIRLIRMNTYRYPYQSYRMLRKPIKVGVIIDH